MNLWIYFFLPSTAQTFSFTHFRVWPCEKMQHCFWTNTEWVHEKKHQITWLKQYILCPFISTYHAKNNWRTSRKSRDLSFSLRTIFFVLDGIQFLLQLWWPFSVWICCPGLLLVINFVQAFYVRTYTHSLLSYLFFSFNTWLLLQTQYTLIVV